MTCPIIFCGCVLLLAATGWSLAAERPAVPDLTQGGVPDKRHDWNLGPTGARGWIWGWKLETTESRQILITSVAPNSPAAGVLEKGDVVLGVDGNPFTQDARKSFGEAITRAETEERGGLLKVLRWRNGKTSEEILRLKVMGTYHDRSPWDCRKSASIVKAGCEHIVSNVGQGIDGKINILALLASGEKAYERTVREYVRRLGPSDLELEMSPRSAMASWHWGYTNLLLTEYYLATGDKEVLPAIREFTRKIARGQSGVGTWGHAMAWPQWNDGKEHGRLGGYGALNQVGLVCQLSLVLGMKCGVDEPEVREAVTRGNEFFGFYVGKGSIPYGDHGPAIGAHDDNGKNSIAALVFDLQDHRTDTQFFSRMTVASHGERERGHTGNYFSYLWGALGAMRAGNEAAAGFLKEQRWFYDLNRSHDGKFHYQGGAGSHGAEHKYGNWDCTGAFLLAYLLPKGRLYLTGKGVRDENRLTGAALLSTLEAGEGFDSWDLGLPSYRQASSNDLLVALRSWSPAVRFRAARALGERDKVPVAELIDRLDGHSLTERYGACEALEAIGERAAPAVGPLQALLWHDDIWLRIQAAEALAAIGKPAEETIPVLLKLASSKNEKDPREMTQRYLAFCLFSQGNARMKGMITKPMGDVEFDALKAAVERLLENQDGRARAAVGSLYEILSYDEVKPLLPAVHKAILEPAPSGVMFASAIRLRGLELLADHRIKEGIPLCVEIMDIHSWGKRDRIMKCLQVLRTYGGAAKPILPRLRILEKELKSHREARSLRPHIAAMEETIAFIENAAEGQEALRTLAD